MAAASKPPTKKAPPKKGAPKQKGGVAAALTRKLGPLPAWGWLGILAVGVWYYRKTHASATSTTGTTPDSSPQVFPGGGGFGGGGGGDGGGGDSPPSSPTPNTPPPTLTPGGPGVNPPPQTGGSKTAASINHPIFAGQSAVSLATQGVKITPATKVTAPNPGAGKVADVGSGIAGLGGGAGGTFVPITAIKPAAISTKTSSATAAAQKSLAATKPLPGGTSAPRPVARTVRRKR